MHPQHSRKMSGRRKGLRTWKWHFLLMLWILMLANPQRNARAYFLGDIKAVLNGCEEHWTLQDEAQFPRLYRMTVCVNIRVVAPGPWIAFTYSSVHGLMPELGLEGDEGALYVWLLRVKHRFPMQLSLQDWHQVCLRRDVVGSSFSMEVDGRTVGQRVVIAQAIPSYGSLWLGCGQRDQPEGVVPGQVELYLFRLWADLEQHQPCEDGSVIGWRSDYWGVTSANARQRDDNLPCVHRKSRHRYRRERPSDVTITTVPSSVTTPPPDPSTELTCHFEQLCSSHPTYFWMPVSVKNKEGFESEKEIHHFMSSVFTCEGKGNPTATNRSDFDIFCLEVSHLEVENVSCIIKEDKRKSRCGVVLQLSSPVSACELRQAGLSALQQIPDKHIEVTGAVERVGWCDDVDLSSGGFVTCPSLPLEEKCQSNDHSALTCNILKPDRVLNNPANQNSCSVHRKAPHRYRRHGSSAVPEEETDRCSCTTFCNNHNHFYAQQLNVTDFKKDTKFLQDMLTHQVIQTCGISPNAQCISALQVLQNQGLSVLQLHDDPRDDQTDHRPLSDHRFTNTYKQHWKGCNGGASHSDGAANESVAVLLSDNCQFQMTSFPPPIKTTAIPSTTTTMTQAKTTQSIQSTSPPTTTPTTVTTAAEPTTNTHTSSSTLYTHNTEVTTKQSTAQSEPTLGTTTLSDTTLKTTNIQTVPATATLMTSETATSSVATQGLSKVTDATTSNTLASTINEASKLTSANPTTASTSDQITTLRSTSDDTTTSKALQTTSISTPPKTKPDTTVHTANSNTIATTTASRITTEEATAASTTVDNTVATSAVSKKIDNSTNVNVASSSTANTLFDSTTSSNVDSTKGDETSMTTVAQTTEVSAAKRTTILSTIFTTTAATMNNNTTKANTTSSKTIDTATVAGQVDDTTEASSTTSPRLVSTSNDTKTTSPTSAPVSLITTTTTDTTTTNGTIQTPSNPLTSAVTGSIPSTTFRDTVATTIATQMMSTQMPHTSGTSSQSTTTGETTTTATSQSVSEPITAEATQVTTTSASFSASTQQQTTINTSEGTSRSESTVRNTHATQQATTNPTTAETTAQFAIQSTMNNVTSPTTLSPASNGSLERGQTSMETVTMSTTPSQNQTTMVTAISGVTASTTDAQSSTTRTTMLPSRQTEHNVTTSSKLQNNTAVISNVTRIMTTPASHTTTTTTNATLGPVTTPYTPKSDVTVSDATMVTTAMTAATTTISATAFTPTTEQTTETIETKPDTPTSMASSNTTTSNKDTTLDSINTSTLAQDTTIKVSDTVAVTRKPETTTSNASESATASTQASKTTSNITAYLTSPSTTNVTSVDSIKTHSSTTTITPTSIQTTESTIKSSVNLTADVTSPGAALTSQSPTPAVTPNSKATITSTTLSTQPTYNRTTLQLTFPVLLFIAPAPRTTLQTTTTRDTSTSDPGLIPTTTEQTTRSQQELEKLANSLLSQTEDVSRLNSSQVSKLVGQLESLLDGPTVSQALGEKAINIISNLMEGDARVLSASAKRLVRLVDGLGLKLEVSGGNEVLSATSLVSAVQTVDWSEFPATTVDIFNTDDVQFNSRRSESSEAPLGSVFLPKSLTESLSPEEQRQANRVQFTFYTKSTLFQDPTLSDNMLVSPVLGSSVANLSITNLRENIRFTIRNAKPTTTNYSASCVFWDFTENGGAGGWNNGGCQVVSITPEDTTCSCSHLTSFAVLLDLSREGITDRQQAQVLTFITYIGCGVSAVFLSITILTYLSFEKLLRDIPAKILVQLCISLLCLNLVFLVDGWLALSKVEGICISTAFFLHYFLLTSFTWAGLEALHMYLSIVRVFTPYLSKYMMKFSIMGWGIPLIVPVIIIAVDKNNYGLVTYEKYSDGTTDDFCWLRDNIAFYVGVVAYFLLMFTLCLVIFIVVLVQLARIKRQNPQNQSPNRGVLTDLRSISGLIILLGLTWGFALFAWGPLYLPFVYLFCIFNSLQGFFIFVFHCAVKENVQKQWRTYLCCGKLRLPENSEWSRTATHNNKNTSFTIMSSSAAHLASSSSYVVSETNSSGSAYADSGIYDGSTSDVVLNEIHRRNTARHL